MQLDMNTQLDATRLEGNSQQGMTTNVEYVSTLVRAGRIFDLLSYAGDRGLGLVEISEALGMQKPTVLRLLMTLVAQRMVERDPETHRYRLGLRLLELGSTVKEQLELPKRARPFLEKLSGLTREAVHLCILDDGQVVYVDHVECPQPLRLHSRLGRRAPVHCTAVGKVLLAHQPPDERRRIIQQWGMKAYTRNTITDYRQLEEQLERVLIEGLAIDREEHEEGVVCVAAPVRDYTRQVVGAINVTAPAFRTPPAKLETFGVLVKDTARRISEYCGFKPTNGHQPQEHHARDPEPGQTRSI